MRTIGVLDLAAGRAVHARAGRRDRYAPVASVAGLAIDPGDALALARAYVSRLGISELYAADLDAIVSGRAQTTLVAALAAVAPLWLDAGVTSDDQARDACALGATRVIVGLETLPSYAALSEICEAVGPATVAFSLDLRNGEPVTVPGFKSGETPEVIAARAVDAGVKAILAIDLARVGAGGGVDLALVGRLRTVVPAPVTLIVGGGVRDAEDLSRLGDAGCDGALVATSLLDGRIGAADIAAARVRQPRAIR